jgi:GLPGLI family protein
MLNKPKSRLAGKITIALLPNLLWLTMAHAQNISAQYAVKFNKIIQTSEQNTKTIALDYTGYLYMAGPKNIYFQKPLYLSQYPTGQIVYNVNNNYFMNYLPIDTIQMLGSMNTDSLIIRHRLDGSVSGDPVPQKKEFTVRILPEAKIINGLQCQHAFLYGKSATGAKLTYWDVWFCPEIPAQYGPFHILGLPGLVVEATSETASVNIKLITYTLNTAIPDAVFWPREFVGASFTELPPYKKRATDGKKTKDAVKADIINQ